MFESMCVTCHGPIELRRRMTAAACSENCHRYWHKTGRTGIVPPKYQTMRAFHAYRRELECTLRWVEKRLVMRAVS